MVYRPSRSIRLLATHVSLASRSASWREFLAQQLEQRLLQREHHDGGLARAVALDGPVAGQVLQQFAHRRPFGGADIVEAAAPGAPAKLLEEPLRQFRDFGFPLGIAPPGFALQAGEPGGQQPLVVPIDHGENNVLRAAHSVSIVCGCRNDAANRAASSAESKCRADPCATMPGTIRMGVGNVMRLAHPA